MVSEMKQYFVLLMREESRLVVGKNKNFIRYDKNTVRAI